MIDINNKYWAYFLGFFWGDGCFKSGEGYKTPNIRIVEEDALSLFSVFEKVAFFEFKRQELKNRRTQGGFFFKKNRELIDLMLENDFLSKSKGSPTKILSKIDSIYHRYFWLGYIDADGCFYKRRGRIGGSFSLSGSCEQDWSDFFFLLRKLEIENFFYFRKDFSYGRSSSIEIKYGPDLVRLNKYLYPCGFEFGLKRKFDKCQDIISSLPEVTSQWKGIGFHKGEGRWRAYGPKNKYLGWFDTEEEARQARSKYLVQITAS